MKKLWTGQVHVLTPPAQGGDTRAFTNVVTWADDAEDFAAAVAKIFARRHWTVLDVKLCMPAADCKVMTAELADQVERAKEEPDACVFGTLHYYPSKPA
jgi:hypothetical protein